jgi:hypothetical protein
MRDEIKPQVAPKPEPTPYQQELDAMRECVVAMTTLDDMARQRVMLYLNSRYMNDGRFGRF